jgi:hypothetical protein
MATSDNIRNRIIEKILAIRNEKLLISLEKLLSSSKAEEEIISLTREQELMLLMSEDDIKYGRTTSHEDLMNRTEEWLLTKTFS